MKTCVYCINDIDYLVMITTYIGVNVPWSDLRLVPRCTLCM